MALGLPQSGETQEAVARENMKLRLGYRRQVTPIRLKQAIYCRALLVLALELNCLGEQALGSVSGLDEEGVSSSGKCARRRR